jgi:cephalosporin-C deacetylase-like acetyl esterase
LTTLSEFVYFPDDENWATWMTRVIAMTNFGGSDFGEIHRTVKGLKSGDYEGWHNRWRNMGEYVFGLASNAEKLNHKVTARKSYLRAFTYYRMSQLWVTQEAISLQMYDKMSHCFSKWASLSNPKVEHIEVPFEGTKLSGWILPPKAKIGDKPPVLFYCSSEAGACEGTVFTGPLEASERGIASVIVDCPGQGSTLKYKKVLGRPDYEKPFGAIADYLETRVDLDSKRLGVFGSDMGAYFAVRAAAFDKRVKALGNITSCYDVYQDIYLPGKENHREGLHALLGTSDPAEVKSRLSPYTLKGIAEKVTCPLFIMHAEETVVYPVEPAYRVYREARGPKELHIVNAGHTIMDRRMEAISSSMDWIADHLLLNSS